MNLIALVVGFILFWTVVMPFLYNKATPWLLLNLTPFKRELKTTHDMQMKSITDLKDSTLAQMLHDPNVSVQDLENFKQKAKVVIETIQMAQKAENEQLAKLASGITSGKINP